RRNSKPGQCQDAPQTVPRRSFRLGFSPLENRVVCDEFQLARERGKKRGGTARGLVYARTFRDPSGLVSSGAISGGGARRPDAYFSRFRFFRLSNGALPSREFLARGGAAVESAQRLRPAVSRTM